MSTKEQLEHYINNSDLFNISEVKDKSLYDTKQMILINHLVEYYSKYIYYKKNLDEYGYILVITARSCIKSYEKREGNFLNYFNFAMKRAYKKENAIEREKQARGGIKLKKDDEKTIRNVYAFASQNQLDLNEEKAIERVSEYFGIKVSMIKDLIKINEQAISVPEEAETEDGGVINIIETIADTQIGAEEKIISKDDVEEIFNIIEVVFEKMQDREDLRGKVSMLITVKILSEYPNEYIDLLRKYKFFSEESYNFLLREKRNITAKEIAKKFGVSEQSISRTYKNFEKQLKFEMQKT